MPLFVPWFAEASSATIEIDGVTYRVPLIDSDGHLQVDVLTSTLPAGAATSANQAAMITALQLIDDLRTALASVAADQLRTDVISSALPAGAATSARQDTMITALQLIDDLRGALDAVQGDRLNVNVYRDGASEVKSINATTTNPSTTRVTLLTPTSGKKVRIVGVIIANVSVGGANMELYFGTGSNFTTDRSKVIVFARLEADVLPSFELSFPDGGGPVGAVDEVVSMRTGTNITTNGIFIIHYREE